MKCQPRLDKNADNGTLVSYLITFQRRLDSMLRGSFDNDVLFTNTIRETFVALFQQRKDDIAEIFACYFDYRFKDIAQETNVSKWASADAEKWLIDFDRSMMPERNWMSPSIYCDLFQVRTQPRQLPIADKYIGKDLFEAVYKHQMVKRLVNPVSSKSFSLKFENQIIGKLGAGTPILYNA